MSDEIPPGEPERPPEAEACPDCGYPIGACECAALFGEDPMAPVGPVRTDDSDETGGEDGD